MPTHSVVRVHYLIAAFFCGFSIFGLLLQPTVALSKMPSYGSSLSVTNCKADCDLVSFRASFFRQGRPYPVTFTISDGEVLQVFKAVKNIDTAVSRTATFIVQYILENGEINKDIIHRLPLDTTRNKIELNFYLFSSDEQKLIEPLLFAEEVGANIEVQNRLGKKDGRFILTTDIRGKPGALYIIDSKFGTPEPQTGVSCEACKPSHPTKNHVKSLSGQSTPTQNTISFLSAATQQNTTEFEELGDGVAGLMIAGALRDLFNVSSFEATLTDVNSKEYPSRSDGSPDYVVPSGFYIVEVRLETIDGIDGPNNLKIPIYLDPQQVRQLLIDISDFKNLQNFYPTVIGDIELGTKIFGMAVQVLGTHFLEKSVLLDIYAESTGWVLVPLPQQVSVQGVARSNVDSLSEQPLEILQDYTINRSKSRQFIILRVRPGRGWYTINFREPYFYFSPVVKEYRIPKKASQSIGTISGLTLGSSDPVPLECVSDNAQIRAACFLTCGIAQNVGCSCSFVQDGCSCDCYGIP